MLNAWFAAEARPDEDRENIGLRDEFLNEIDPPMTSRRSATQTGWIPRRHTRFFDGGCSAARRPRVLFEGSGSGVQRRHRATVAAKV
jgi:hypothetical protein